MLLEELRDYDARCGSSFSSYQDSPVMWEVRVPRHGSLYQWTMLPKTGNKRFLPHRKRNSGGKPLLLSDNGEYVFGIARSAGKKDRAQKNHVKFMELLARCANEVREPSVTRVCEAVKDPKLLSTQPKDFDPKGRILFRVEDEVPTDLASVRAFWSREVAGFLGVAQGTCMLCGRGGLVYKRHSVPIRGIQGGQPTGLYLVSADRRSYSSYGQEAGLNSPICVECADAAASGLNRLLEDQYAHANEGPLTVVYWTRAPREFTGALFSEVPNETDETAVKHFFESLVAGQPVEEALADHFYAATLSAHGSRLVLHDWIDMTIPELDAAFSRWFEWQCLALTEDGRPGRLFSAYALADSLFRLKGRPASESPKPSLRIFHSLIRSILVGTPLDLSLLARALARNRAEQSVPAPRAALMKAVLVSRHLLKEGSVTSMAGLDPSYSDEAYQWGRLFATFEGLQEAAHRLDRQVGNGVVKRFFGLASSAPAQAYSRLTQLSLKHLEVLRQTRSMLGVYRAYLARLEEIQDRLSPDGLGRRLSLPEQAKFDLGYYHQRSEDAKRRKERMEASAQKTKAS